jgi:ribonucleotide reductase alpha subunit
MEALYSFEDIHGKHRPLVSSELWQFVSKYSSELNKMIDYNRDYLIDFFGFKTLERAYLFKKEKTIVERPQHMWMRVSIGIHGNIHKPESLKLVEETYNLMFICILLQILS